MKILNLPDGRQALNSPMLRFSPRFLLYTNLFFIIEVLIALYVQDDFTRPKMKK